MLPASNLARAMSSVLGDHGIFEKQPHAKCRTYPILSDASVFPVARSGTPSTVATSLTGGTEALRIERGAPFGSGSRRGRGSFTGDSGKKIMSSPSKAIKARCARMSSCSPPSRRPTGGASFPGPNGNTQALSERRRAKGHRSARIGQRRGAGDCAYLHAYKIA